MREGKKEGEKERREGKKGGEKERRERKIQGKRETDEEMLGIEQTWVLATAASLHTQSPDRHCRKRGSFFSK